MGVVLLPSKRDPDSFRKQYCRLCASLLVCVASTEISTDLKGNHWILVLLSEAWPPPSN